jgi:hypothetical protein
MTPEQIEQERVRVEEVFAVPDGLQLDNSAI